MIYHSTNLHPLPPMQAQAKDICLTLAQAFDAVYNKMKLEQNLHKPNER